MGRRAAVRRHATLARAVVAVRRPPPSVLGVPWCAVVLCCCGVFFFLFLESVTAKWILATTVVVVNGLYAENLFTFYHLRTRIKRTR